MLKMCTVGRRQIALVVSVSQAALYNLFTAAGNPADVVDVVVSINTSVDLQAGFTTGTGWQPGCTLTIIKNGGRICGLGGANTGGIFGAGGFATSSTLDSGSAGHDGSEAIALLHDLAIDNTDGYVLGGGGGGGGGGACARTNPPGTDYAAAGGGGGGGRGFNNAVGGALGTGNGTALTLATDGAAGSSSAPGTYGVGEHTHTLDGKDYDGGKGGRGGDWGENGVYGDPGVLSHGATGTTKSGGLGGLAGRAVKLNGFAVTWLGGNNSTQIRGVVS